MKYNLTSNCAHELSLHPSISKHDYLFLICFLPDKICYHGFQGRNVRFQKLKIEKMGFKVMATILIVSSLY